MFQISYYRNGETTTKRVPEQYKNLETYERAKLLLFQEMDVFKQSGLKINEIKDDCFICFDPLTQNETTYQVEVSQFS